MTWNLRLRARRAWPRLLLVLTGALAACGDSGTGVDLQAPASIVVSPAEVRVASLGEAVTFTARVLDWQGREIQGVPLVWTSDNGRVLVGETGAAFRSVGNGLAVVRAQVDPAFPGMSARRAGQAPVEGAAAVVVEQRAATLRVSATLERLSALGQESRLAAQLADANGHALAREPFPVWMSESPAVASVDAAGIVLARSDGSTRITATLEQLTASIVIRVSAALTYQACLKEGNGATQSAECVTTRIVVMQKPGS